MPVISIGAKAPCEIMMKLIPKIDFTKLCVPSQKLPAQKNSP